MTVIVARDNPMAAGTPRGSPPMSVTSDASIATSAPVPIAIPRSAWASAGASLMPSPTIATVRPRAWSRCTIAALSAGSVSGTTLWIGMPTCLATDSAVARASPVTSQTSMLRGGQLANRGLGFDLDGVADREQPGRHAVDGDDRGRPARARRGLDRVCQRRQVDPTTLEQPAIADERRCEARRSNRPFLARRHR